MSSNVRKAFADLVSRPDEAIELDRGALLIAKSCQPELEIEPYLQLLDLMAEHVKLRLRGTTDARLTIAEINRYLFEDEHFVGNNDSYYDPRNSYLNEVMDRKVGIPISLSILYLEIGRRLGFKLEGVGLPGHFMVKHPGAQGDILIDPYHQGSIVTEEDCRVRLEGLFGGQVPFDKRFLQAMAPRKILMRMLNNLKAIFLHAHDLVNAVNMVELSLCADPDNPEEIKARGLLYLQLECFGQAWSDLERYVELCPEADDLEAMQKYLTAAKELTSKIN